MDTHRTGNKHTTAEVPEPLRMLMGFKHCGEGEQKKYICYKEWFRSSGGRQRCSSSAALIGTTALQNISKITGTQAPELHRCFKCTLYNPDNLSGDKGRELEGWNNCIFLHGH